MGFFCAFHRAAFLPLRFFFDDMALNDKYNPQEIEDTWYAYWMQNKYFHSTPDDREAYSIVIPPPNVTGVLHMGHMLNNTIQDILVRRARMLGKNACWVPGTDHASIATEAKVVAKLKADGIEKDSLTRDEFMKHAYQWKDKHGGIILEQLKKLGASCDWDRTAFTMDEDYSESVIDTFIDLHKKGHIYRGTRMVNWDPSALTTVSDEEVIHKEVNGKLYYIKYKVAGSEETLTVATTRPETIFGDSAICINPNDERFTHLHGKKAIVPMVNREIPIILDDYVDVEFGTGCLKVTPAHDINDYELGKKHTLENINILNADGTLNEAAQFFVGEDRFAVRKQMKQALTDAEALVKIEDYSNKVGFSERTDAVIEPRISMQWYVAMEKLAKPALDAVMQDDVQFHPPKFKNTYRYWMENVKDWCISRQLWWGHRIPAFYYGEGENDFVIAKTVEEALPMAIEASGNASLKLENLRQDEDVLDTWFSSWLWPISTFDGEAIKNGKGNISEELKYYFPTNDLVTAPEIMFFWVARMIIAGYEYLGEKPFSNVYYTGIVRDPQGRKMSKSLGNSPDPIKLMEKHGADGVRVGMLLTSPAGNDLLFDESLCEQGRNFSNKLWNAYRLIHMWEAEDKPQPEYASFAIQWFESRFSEALGEINDHFDKFRMSDALMSSYKLVWDDFCSWFLEMVKPPYGEKIDSQTLAEVKGILENVLRILHPFMPFVTEALWQDMADRSPEQALIVAQWPKAKTIDAEIAKTFKQSNDAIVEIRNFRKEYQIANKVALEIKVDHNTDAMPVHLPTVSKLANVESWITVSEKPEAHISFLVNGVNYYIAAGDNIDTEAEKAKIEEEIKYLNGFLVGVNKKLSNERFVNSAPEKVVAIEKKKQADALEKVKQLEAKLSEF